MAKKTKTPDQKSRFIVYPMLFYISLALAVIGIGSYFFLKDRLPPEIPLFYGLAEGTEQLAPSKYLILPSVLGFLILIINLIISASIKNTFYKKILLLCAFATNVLVAITIVKIILLVGDL
jgi:hypothetical protein